MILRFRVRIPSVPAAFVLSALLILSAGTSLAQQPRFEWPERAKNLKVLPKNTPKEKLQATMIGYTRALGVRCPFCHVGEEGKPLTTFDFVSDEKPTKQVARGMMKMVNNIEKDLKKIKFTHPDRATVACVTCHRGRPRPMTLAEELASVYRASGVDSTVARYRMLRQRFYGTGSYDFSERSLNEVGSSLLSQGKSQDAILIFQLNVEQNPSSSFAYSSLADAYAAAGQKDLAIQNYEKAISLEPRNREAEQKLKELREGK
jgi:tetratricopeptide (TPR) repeat protein